MKAFKELLKEAIIKEDNVSGVYKTRDDLLQKLWKDGYTMENRRGRDLPDKEYVWKNNMIFKVPFTKNSDGSYIVKNIETLGKGSLSDFNNFLDGRYTPVKESKKLTESKKRAWDEIEFENIAAGLKIADGYDGIYVQTYSGGSGFNKVWKSDKYTELTKQAQESKDWKIVGKEIESLTDDLAKAADMFDRTIASIMAKHGFKK